MHEELDQRISHYLEAPTITLLYDSILQRLEEDYEKERPGLVREAVSLLWAGRRGLSEGELMELLGSSDGPLPRAVWSPLYLAMEESLVSRTGLLGFFHDYLRQAVYERYIGSFEMERGLHVRFADYFGMRELDDRKVDELPWQLAEAKEWEHLQDCVTDMDMFLRLRTEAKQYELMGYWLAMGDRFDMAEAYNKALNRYEKSVPSDEALSHTLNEIA